LAKIRLTLEQCPKQGLVPNPLAYVSLKKWLSDINNS